MPTCDLAPQIFAALPRTSNDGPPSQFLRVPGIGEPRWLLPRGLSNIDSVLSSWSPYRASSHPKWQAIRAASRVGLTHLLPSSAVTTVGNIAGIDWRRLGWTGSAPPVLVIYIGTLGVSRKAVIHLVDRVSGQCSLVVKVPLAKTAKPAILREAGMLASLAEEHYACAPQMLHVDHERGIASQIFVWGTPTGRRLCAEHLELLRSLMLPDETTTIGQRAAALQEHPLWPAACETYSDILRAALSELCDTHLLPAFWVHGDFAPWNIKRQADKLILIDWEDAQRGGLPLHDLYHFTHMQDYLFGCRPSVHCTAVERFADSIGITRKQCRGLEIAYLANSCLQSISRQQEAHAKFLLRTLSITLQTRSCSLVVSQPEATDLHIARRPATPGSPQIREQLFTELIAQLNSDGIRYCVLGGYDNETGAGASDVDLMVHPADLQRMPLVLRRCSRSAGGRLVQAMQHETTGCYFILAKHDGHDLDFLDPDCCSDYRRQGRLWLPADEVISGRQRHHDFYVPSGPDQFTYYLLKKVLKQSITAPQLKRLQHLYMRNPLECRARLARYWPPSAALQIQLALVELNLVWFQTRMQKLLMELRKSAPMENGFDRIKTKMRELGRLVKRAVFPTGLSVLVVGSDSRLNPEIADGLLQTLAPAFRRIAKAAPGQGLWSSLRLAAAIFRARRQSTLIISTAELAEPAIGPHRTAGQLRSLLTRLFLRPDLVLALGSPAVGGTGQSVERDAPLSVPLRNRARMIHLDAASSPEQTIAEATSIVLAWLASHLERRLASADSAFDRDASFTPAAEPVELPCSGLD